MSNERQVFDATVRRHHAAVYQAARRIVRSDADAADVTQQVFLLAWRGRIDVHGDDAATGGRLRWFAQRLALGSLRAGGRRRHHEQETATMHARHRPPETKLHPDELAAVHGAIDALDDDQRTAVVLRFQENLTLAAIGQATGCAESTVHARLAQALAKLRHRLRDAGFAALALDVERAAGEAAAHVLPVPQDLLPRLLAIPTAGTLAVGKLVVAATLLLGGGTAALLSLQEGGAAAEPALLAARVVEPSARAAAFHAGAAALPQEPTRTPAPTRGDGQRPASGQPVREAQELPVATVSGSVMDPTGAPIAGVDVLALCPVLSSKGQPFERRTRTDANGAFVLELPVADPGGVGYRLFARCADWAGGFAEPDLVVRGGDRRQAVDATLRRWATDEEGAWSTDVLVTDVAGRPIAGAIVRVFRRVAGNGDAPRLVHEAGRRTDERGRAPLTGDHFGEKLVRVATFGQPFAPLERELAITAAEPPPIDVALAADAPLAVRVVDARSAAPLAGVMITAERDGDSLAVGNSDADGRVSLRGLDASPCELVGGNGPWSPFRVADVHAGREPVTLRLKRLDDPEDVGLHRAELHGRVLDAASGQPIAVAAGAVQVRWLADDGSETIDSIRIDAIHPTPVQTMLVGEPPPPSATFHVPVRDAGRYALVLRAEGYAVAVAGPFALGDDELRSGIELRCERGIDVEVAVRDANGAPVADAEVWIGAADAAADEARAARAKGIADTERVGRRALGGRGGRSDAHGRCTFRAVPTGLALRVHAASAAGHGGSDRFTGGQAGPDVRAAIVVR